MLLSSDLLRSWLPIQISKLGTIYRCQQQCWQSAAQNPLPQIACVWEGPGGANWRCPGAPNERGSTVARFSTRRIEIDGCNRRLHVAMPEIAPFGPLLFGRLLCKMGKGFRGQVIYRWKATKHQNTMELKIGGKDSLYHFLNWFINRLRNFHSLIKPSWMVVDC